MCIHFWVRVTNHLGTVEKGEQVLLRRTGALLGEVQSKECPMR